MKMELSYITQINILGLIIGFISVLSDQLYVHGQRSNRFREGSLRLLGGRSKNEGTVLIYHWSRWGSICDDYWDIRDANVVCNELGYPGALAAPRRSRFGKGRRRVWLSGLHCRGNERQLTMCISRGWGNYLRRCRSYWSSAGVVCKPKPETDVTTERTRHRGRHRNRNSGQSGRSRSYNTTINPTTPSSTSTTSSTTTTTISTTAPTTITTPTTSTKLPTTLKLLSTTEAADDILAELGLSAEKATLPPANRNIELQSSNKSSESSTIHSQSGSDYSLSRSTSGPITAAAPARQAYREDINIQADGIPVTDNNVISTKPSTSKSTDTSTKQPSTSTTTITTTTTGRPTTKPVTTEMTTKTSTTTSQPRAYNRWVYDRESWRYFMYFRDGSFITSRPDPRYYRYVRTSSTMRPTTKSTTTTTTSTIRPTTRSAPVPQPAPIRVRTYNLNEISNAINSNKNTSHGNTQNDISNAIDVMPNNQRQRSFNDLTRHEGRHRHRQHPEGKPGYVGDQPKEDATLNEIPPVDATVIPDMYGPDYTEFRVVGGREYENYREGRIEIRLAGTNHWGVICGDSWDMRGAIVTCKHLGTGYARVAQTTDFYGGSNMDKIVASLRCTGKEQRLEDCVIEKDEREPGKPKCSKPQSVAGVICETRLPDLEVDVQALQQSVYLQDRYAYYLECAYEEGCLSSSASALYDNKRRWDYATRRLLRFSTIAMNIGKADFRPNIDRSKWEWHACHMHFHSMEAFSYYDIIDSHGNRIAEGHKASFCLEDSQCDRGVYPKYDCQHNGHQGISVGCRDSYLHDIDCQWIDVTDVSPGTYTLKVELNPDMLVPEISFDNNVAVCKLYISGQRAQAWGCKLGSLL